jgi:Tol biopolymer transport system component/DNA-binding winged helix-turn-helix (wHTH) protein
LKAKRFYKFGRFAIDATAKVVLAEGQPLHLTRKAVETLLVLAENCGQVLTKEEVMGAVWPDRVVDEANLKQNVAVIRRALALEPGNPGYIETYPGRGYRMVGPVELVEEEAPAISPAPRIRTSETVPWYRRRRFVMIGLVVVALGAWVWTLLRKPSPPREELHIVPVTRFAGKEFQPAVSPDGQKVAFVWAQEGSSTAGIWIQAFGQAKPQMVTRQEGRHSSPAWGPDGKSLAYLRIGKTSTDVLISIPETGEERLIAALVPPDYGYEYRLLDWSPDGEWLAVAHSEAPDKPLGLSVIAVRTGERRRLTQPEEVVGGDLDPRFSRDGQSISFVRLIHRSNQELFLTPLQGGASRQLTRDGRQVAGHDWTPDGKTIVFSSDRGGEFRLWRIQPHGSNPAKTLQPIGIYGEFPIQLSLARKAPCLAYSVLQQDRNIWRLDVIERKWTRIIASSGQDASPQYAPAGDRICFRSDRSGEDQLWVGQADGSDPVQVTRGPLWPSVGRWSPDGQSIVFNNARTGEIFLATQAGAGGWRVRSLGAQGYHPVFSLDGQWVYAGLSGSIWRIPVHGGPASELVKVRGVSFALSGDGKFLYFMREPHGSSLWRASTATGELAKALDGLIPSCTSCWALAPNGIYYLGSDKQSPDKQVIYFHDFRTGLDREVTEYPELLPPLGSGPFSLSPDLRYLLCVRLDPSNSDVMRVDPFR